MKLQRITLALLSIVIAFSVSAANNMGSWQPIVNQPYNSLGDPNTFPTAGYPLLMTDGSLFVLNYNYPHTGEAWKLTPDISGNYVNGKWSQLASLPIINGAQYSPLYMAQAVLPDGRIVILGGEYDGPLYSFANTTKGAIYDPKNNKWQALMMPNFFTDLITGAPIGGDSPCVVLADGTFMVANNYNNQAAFLNPVNLNWQEVGTATKQRTFFEGGLVLLPSGNVFHKDVFGENHLSALWPNVPFPANGLAEIFDATSKKWSSAGYAPVDLVNPRFQEQGPSILRADGTVLTFSGGYGNSAIYDSYNKTWSAGPTFPSVTLPGFEAAKLAVTNPISFNTLNTKVANFGPQSFLKTGPIVPTIPDIASPTVTNDLTGAIALVSRGSATFVTKVRNSQNAGAIGVIIYNNVDDGTTPGMADDGTSSDITIPSIGISYADGHLLLNNLSGLTGTISARTVPIMENIPLSPTDAPAVLLPNGNVLIGVAPPVNAAGDVFLNGIHIFEVTKDNQLNEQPTVLGAADMPVYALGSVLLPTGQVFTSDSIYGYAQIYTPGDTSYNSAWKPIIDEYPDSVKPGRTYKIKGFLFNGMSQAQNVNDENMSATNYPLVRITFSNTGHVFYCRTHDHNFMGVAQPNRKVQTYFDVPTSWAGFPMEYGNAKLEVIANGIPSKSVRVKIEHQ